MLEALPDRIDPLRLARGRKRLCGQVPLARMPRLCTSLQRIDGHVDVDLQFDRDAERLARMTGTAQALLVFSCQRCLEPVALEVCAEVNVVLLAPGERVVLQARQESTEVVGGSMPLTEMVEDELILSLPITPMHEESECRAVRTRQESPRVRQEEDNPFAVLSSFKPRR